MMPVTKIYEVYEADMVRLEKILRNLELEWAAETPGHPELHVKCPLLKLDLLERYLTVLRRSARQWVEKMEASGRDPEMGKGVCVYVTAYSHGGDFPANV